MTLRADLPLTGVSLAPVPDDPAALWAARLLRALGASDSPDGGLLIAPGRDSGPVSDWAASGAMSLTGTRDGPPLVCPGQPATAARGALLAFDAIAGQPCGFSGHHLLSERAALAGGSRQAPWSVGGGCRAVRTRDGWVAVSLARDTDAALLPALVEGDGQGERWSVLQTWAQGRCAAEVVERAQLLGLAVAPVQEAAPAPWPPWRVTSTGTPGAGPALALVVDLSSLWAGPLCASLLGRAGARVVRVESSSRPDGGRLGCPPFDDLLHEGQESVAIPFGTASGRAQLRDLVAGADVVITSARPRAIEQLGLDPARHLADRSGGVWVSVTAHPARPDGTEWVGFGDDCALAGGLVQRLPDGTPVPCGDAVADPLTGMHAAVASLAGLRAGGRHHVQLSLQGVAASTSGPSHPATARRRGEGWEVDGEHGTVAVAPPRVRRATDRSRPSGADNALLVDEASRRKGPADRPTPTAQ